MSLTEERMQVLKMLEEGKITAEEAAKLLSALEEGVKAEQEPRKSPQTGPKKRRVRISVTDSATGKQKKVNVNLPIGVVKIAKKMSRFPGDFDGIKIDDILDEIDAETEGKIIDVQDDEGNKRVEIFVE